MKLKKSSIAIWLFFFFETEGFGLIQLTKFGIYRTDFINIGLIALSFCLIFIYGWKLTSDDIYKKWVIAGLVIHIVTIIYSCLIYSQGLIDVLKVSLFYFVPLLYFPLVRIFNKYIKNVDDIFRYIVFVALIISILGLLQRILYSRGIVFIDTVFQGSTRYGAIRFTLAESTVAISLLYLISKALKNKLHNNIRFILIISIEILYFILVLKTRSDWMCIIISVLGAVALSYKNNLRKLAVIALVVIAVFYIYSNGIVGDFISELTSDYGVQARQVSYGYYWNQFLKKPFLGMGYINGSVSQDLSLLLNGQTGHAYRNDVGFLGLLNELGIVGGLWYVVLVIKVIKNSYQLNIQNSSIDLWSTMFSIYLISTSVNLLMTNAIRMPMLIFAIAIMDTASIQLKNQTVRFEQVV